MQGPNRYPTAAATTEFAYGRTCTDCGYAGIAGTDYPDCLTGGITHIDTVAVFGGTSAVSESARACDSGRPAFSASRARR
ncbi:MAG: hypothetical protein ACYC6C_03250 [Coriobacteriia bacterium]